MLVKHFKKVSIKKIILLFCLTVFCYLGLLILNISRKIDNYLNFDIKPKTVEILSDSQIFHQGSVLEKNKLLRKLKTLNYKESTKSIEKSYQLKNDLIIINTASFTDSKGDFKKTRKIAYDFKKHKIISLDKFDNQFYLEPYPITLEKGEHLKDYKKVTFQEIPEELIKLLIFVEDSRFYQHFGIDLIGIFRALSKNILHLEFKEGGSTITQQLIKNVFLKRDKKIIRKLKEVLYSIILELKTNKNQILELYLNEIYFGQRGETAIFGIEKAANIFYNKKATNLNLLETASFIALLRTPSLLSPFQNLKKLQQNAKAILRTAYENKIISLKSYNKAKNLNLLAMSKTKPKSIAPYFIEALYKNLAGKIEFNKNSSYKIYTGLNLNIQKCAEKAIENRINNNSNLEVSLVAIDPTKGLIKAWVGGKDFKKSEFDRVNMSTRQIGSLVKPFIYLQAFENEKQLTPQSTVLDLPINIKLKNNKIWTPQNFDNKFLGAISIRNALEKSRNIPAVLKAKENGFEKLNNLLNNLNITNNKKYTPSISLGAIESSLLNITSAYGGLANNGEFIVPRLYKSIIKDNELFIENKLEKSRFTKNEIAFTINHILKGVLTKGTAKITQKLGFTEIAAGKTGTTNNGRDNWFIGYTPKLVVGVWVGRDDNKPTKLTSSKIAVPIWTDFMLCNSRENYDTTFSLNNNVTVIKIDKKSQQIATPNCPNSNVISEAYIIGREPESYCKIHKNNHISPKINDHLKTSHPKRNKKFLDIIVD